MEAAQQNKMGVQPVGRLLFKMSLPMMLSMLMLALYNIVDSIFVSRISEDALTALSLAFPFQMLVVAVAVGTGVGINSLIARRLGEQRYEDANLAAGNGQFLALVSAAAFTLVFALFSRPLLALFAEDETILEYAASYMRICGSFCVFSMFQTINEKTMQATGNMIYPMLVQLTGAVLNIIFDPILIFGLLGFPALGVRGAAIATVGGQAAAMALSFLLLYRKTAHLSLRLKCCKPHGKTIKQIYVVGLPSIVMQSIGSVCNFGMNKILMAFTSTAVSVLGVYFKLQSFVFMPLFGMNSGAMPIMGYNYGAKNKPRLMRTFWISLIAAVAIMVTGTAIFQIFAEQILAGLFEASDEMLKIGVPALRTISLGFPLAAVSIMCGTMYSALGIGVYSLFNSIVRQLLVILPAAYLLGRFWGLAAVWYAYPLAEGVCLVLSLILVLRAYRQRIRPLEAVQAEPA